MAMISLDYDKVMRAVRQLENAKIGLQTAQNDAKKALNNMNTYWEGAAANAFLEGIEKWCAEMKSIEREVGALSGSIVQVADEIRKADKRAKTAINNNQ